MPSAGENPSRTKTHDSKKIYAANWLLYSFA